jgi:hypothetical protein
VNVQPGDRVQITGTMPGDPDPLPIGTTGTVVRVNRSAQQADVNWDAVNPVTGQPRTLLLLLDVDPFQVIGKAPLPEPTCKGYGPPPEDDQDSPSEDRTQ